MFARQGSVPSSFPEISTFPGTRAKMNTKFIHPSRHQGPSPARDSYEALYILPLPTNLQCWAPSSTSSSSTSLSSSSSSGRSTRVNGTRAPCSSVQEELLRQRCNQRQSEAIKRPSSFQEAINETHLLEKELLGGRDGALRLEIAARLMREAIRGVIRGVIRGNLRQSEAIGGNPRQSGRRAEIAARLGVQFYLQTLLQRGTRGGDCGLWQKRVGRAP